MLFVPCITATSCSYTASLYRKSFIRQTNYIHCALPLCSHICNTQSNAYPTDYDHYLLLIHEYIIYSSLFSLRGILLYPHMPTNLICLSNSVMFCWNCTIYSLVHSTFWVCAPCAVLWQKFSKINKTWRQNRSSHLPKSCCTQTPVMNIIYHLWEEIQLRVQTALNEEPPVVQWLTSWERRTFRENIRMESFTQHPRCWLIPLNH